MGDIIWGHTFPRHPQIGAKDTQILTREDAVDHLAAELAKMLDDGETLLVLECKNGETLNVHNDPLYRAFVADGIVEPPADCPA